MKKRQITMLALLVLLALLLAVVPIATSCARPASAPAAPAAHAPAVLELPTSDPGTLGYTLAMGLVGIINKNSTWLKASATAGLGAAASIKEVEANPDLAKRSLLYGGGQTYWSARQGTKPLFDRKYPLVSVMFAAGGVGAFMTLDPNIKTKNDLIGKKIGVGPKGQLTGEQPVLVLQAMGIQDKVTVQYLGFDAAMTALRDGLIDVAYTFIAFRSPPQFFGTHPHHEEVWAQKRTAHFVGPTAAEVKRAAEISGLPLSYLEVPARAMGDRQPEPIGTLASNSGFFAYPQLDIDILTEFLRISYERSSDFANIHSSMGVITPKTMGWLHAFTEEDVHPAALKFFKERGVPIYVGGASPLFK